MTLKWGIVVLVVLAGVIVLLLPVAAVISFVCEGTPINEFRSPRNLGVAYFYQRFSLIEDTNTELYIEDYANPTARPLFVGVVSGGSPATYRLVRLIEAYWSADGSVFVVVADSYTNNMSQTSYVGYDFIQHQSLSSNINEIVEQRGGSAKRFIAGVRPQSQERLIGVN